MLLRIDHSGNGSRDADRLVSHGAGVGNHVALSVQIHVTAGGFWSFFAIVEEVDLAVGKANQHESAATNVSRSRMNDRQREAGGHSSVNRVATLLQNLRANLGGFLMDTDHHSVLGMHRPQTAGESRRGQDRDDDKLWNQ